MQSSAIVRLALVACSAFASYDAFAGCRTVFSGIHSHIECDRDTGSSISDPWESASDIVNETSAQVNFNIRCQGRGGSSSSAAHSLAPGQSMHFACQNSQLVCDFDSSFAAGNQNKSYSVTGRVNRFRAVNNGIDLFRDP